MILCEPFGGISNRFKCIISCLAEDDIILKWEIPSTIEQGGVRCQFNDLFINEFSKIKNDDYKLVNGCEFMHPLMNTNNYGNKNDLNNNLKEKYIKVISSFTPVKYVQDKILEEKSKLPEAYSTVSVRTFTSFKRENDSWGEYFKLNSLLKIMDKINTPILLTCDSPEIAETLKNRYKNIYMTPKRTRFGDFSSVEGMQDILIDLYLGGMGDIIYGTHMSSFSEMQWWFGKCKPQYISMLLHEKK